MSRATFRLVLLVSCAHAMVHVYEQSLPAVEQFIGQGFGVGEEVTGRLGTVWRVPFGVLALLAGWITDRVGAKGMLIVFLGGCSASCVLAWWAPSLAVLFAVMFAMGCFASIYHPSGLALISRETTPTNRGVALGWHGIFGSLGIAGAPFLAALFFYFVGNPSQSWRDYYLMLAVPGVVLAVVIFFFLKEHHRIAAHVRADDIAAPSEVQVEPSAANWPAFFLLVAVGAMFGFIYAGFTHFLARYIRGAHVSLGTLNAASLSTGMATIVLLCGAFGQGLAGKLARPGRLLPLMVLIVWGNVPCLVWMALAEGWMRVVAACALGLVHFMNQPVYNSLIAVFVPRHRRSTGYGFSNMMCFGIGALGPSFVGYVAYTAGAEGDLWAYGSLAGVAATAGVLAIVLYFIVDGEAT